MALKAGYHDDDRDMLQRSIRSIASDVGITLSACRHALAVLERAKLIRRDGPIWTVTKWVMTQEISKRARTRKEQEEQDAAAERRRSDEAREKQAAAERRSRAALEATGKTNFMVWYEQQQRAAEAGDAEAQKTIARHRATYEAHAKEMAKMKSK